MSYLSQYGPTLNPPPTLDPGREDTRHENRVLLQAFDAELTKYGNVDAYLDKCMQAAVFCLGDGPKRKGRGKGHEEEEDDDDDAPVVAGQAWTMYTAQTLRRTGSRSTP